MEKKTKKSNFQLPLCLIAKPPQWFLKIGYFSYENKTGREDSTTLQTMKIISIIIC